jgi:hypothetical protein
MATMSTHVLAETPHAATAVVYRSYAASLIVDVLKKRKPQFNYLNPSGVKEGTLDCLWGWSEAESYGLSYNHVGK